ncbi:MAG: 16S rRNA processing protein RimM [Lachnospiraceae bacterium]|nr:16S rRNA processing protein RimM [Lachnospiraceae bacterium]
MEKLLRIGVVTSTHGLKGEVKIYPTTDDPGRFKKLKETILGEREPDHFSGSGNANYTIPVGTKLHPESVKFFKQFVIVKFKEFGTIEQVEPLKGRELWVDRDNAVKLAPGEHFIADLIGLKIVSDEGEDLGVLSDVLQTGANDVYEVKLPSGKELLIPVIPDCILEINEEEGFIRVHLLDGLMDL